MKDAVYAAPISSWTLSSLVWNQSGCCAADAGVVERMVCLDVVVILGWALKDNNAGDSLGYTMNAFDAERKRMIGGGIMLAPERILSVECTVVDQCSLGSQSDTYRQP